jgi:hypothetical protein
VPRRRALRLDWSDRVVLRRREDARAMEHADDVWITLALAPNWHPLATKYKFWFGWKEQTSDGGQRTRTSSAMPAISFSPLNRLHRLRGPVCGSVAPVTYLILRYYLHLELLTLRGRTRLYARTSVNLRDGLMPYVVGTWRPTPERAAGITRSGRFEHT